MRRSQGENTRRAFLAAVASIGAVTLKGGAVLFGQEQEPPAEVESEKVYILNVLWFEPEGGVEKYAEYGRAVGPIVAKYGGRVDGRAYVPQQNLIGDFDADLVFFVEWPSLASFQKFAQDPDLPAVSALRSSAITKSLLIQCSAAANFG